MGKRLCKLFMVLGLIVCSFSAYDVGVKGDSVIEIKNLSEINKSGDYKLSEDSSLDTVLKIDKTWNVKLNMNGKKVTRNVDLTDRPIVNYGTLKIDGNGTFINKNESCWGIIDNQSGGNLTIDNGSFEDNGTDGATLRNRPGATIIINSINMKSNTSINSLDSKKYGNANINSDGKLIINNGDFSCLSNEGGAYAIISNDDLLIENAKVFGNKGAVALRSGSYVINNGEFRAKNFYGLIVMGSTDVVEGTVNNGTFISDMSNAVLIGNDNLGGDGGLNLAATTTINGGKFISPTGKNALEGAKKTGNPLVKGGTFSNAVAEKFIDKDCHSIKNNDGTYTIGFSAKSASISKDKAMIEKGKSEKLTVNILPSSSIDTVSWTSENDKIASVDQKGNISAKAVGKVKIIATTSNNLTQTCDVTVFEKPAVEQPPVLDQSKPVDQVTPGVINNPKTEQSINETSTAIINGDFQNYTDAQTAANVKAAIEKGESITTSIMTQQMKENEITAPDLKELKRELKALSTKNDSPMLVAQYLDLGVMLKANKNSLGNMTSLVSPISFQVLLPEDLLKEGRTFGVIRIHDGLAELLKATCKDNQLLFESNLFSTYAIVYYDAKEVEKEPVVKDPIVKDPVKKDPVVKEPIIKDSTAKAPTKTPDTFDSTNMIGYVLMLLLAGSTIGVVLVLNKKKKASH
ncbi:MAG: Ig-like domain-containing protein [Erysipelotrichaceae bacterium]